MSKETILYTYVVVCVLYFFSSLLQLDSLEVFVKPLFLPVLLWYYLKKSKRSYQIRVLLSFVFYYIAEMLVLKDRKEFYLLSIFFFLIPYLILLYYVIRDLTLLFKVNFLTKFNFVIFFVFAFLIYLYVSVILIIDIASVLESILLHFYGLVLMLLGISAISAYVIKHSRTNLFLILTIITFIMSDVFYVFILKIDDNVVFRSVNLITQLLSYYFFVTYSLIKAKGEF
jgi:hypothetical protein